MKRKPGWRVVAFVAVLVLSLSACSPVEPEMAYQGRLTDGVGNVVPDGEYGMTFRLYDANDAKIEDALWSETQAVDVEDGLFNVILGAVNDISTPTFAQRLWLGVEIESDGEMTPRQQLTGAPYAMSLAPGAVVQGVVGPHVGDARPPQPTEPRYWGRSGNQPLRQGRPGNQRGTGPHERQAYHGG